MSRGAISFSLSSFLVVVVFGQTTTILPLSSSSLPSPPNKIEGLGGAYIRVLGRSGKITIGRRRDPEQDGNRITLDFASITEIDVNGTAINTQDHFLPNFARVDFSFGSPNNVSLQGVNARFFDFSARIQNTFNAQLVTKVYIFSESGNIVQDNETVPVARGNIKFSTEINNWRFCGSSGVTCRSRGQDVQGAGLEYVIGVRGPSGPRERDQNQSRQKRIRGARDFDMGAGSSIILSTKVRYDGADEYEDIEEGYPMLRQQGSSTQFVFRFRRFNTSVYYDPTVDLGSIISNSGNGRFTIIATLISFLLSVILHYV